MSVPSKPIGLFRSLKAPAPPAEVGVPQPADPLPTPGSEDAPAPTPYKGKSRLEFIDALRGFAALWVMLFHYLGAFRDDTSTHNPLAAALVRFIQCGQMGVNLFLVISGFCLFYPLARKARMAGAEREGMQVRFWPFMVRRARRILPPYWALLAVQTVVMLIYFRLGASAPVYFHLAHFAGDDRHVNFLDVAAHFLMVHNLSSQYISTLATPFWSIALEWQLYLLFPLLILLRNRWGIWRVALGALIVSLCWQIGWHMARPEMSHVHDPETWSIAARTLWSLPGRLSEFVAGMAAAWVVAGGRKRDSLFGLLAVAVTGPLSVYVLYHTYGGAFGPVVNSVWGLFFASLLIAADFSVRLWPVLLRLAKPLISVGIFSYSLYLLHYIIMGAGETYLISVKNRALTEHLIWIFLVAVPLNLAYAYLWYYFFERPVLNAAK